MNDNPFERQGHTKLQLSLSGYRAQERMEDNGSARSMSQAIAPRRSDALMKAVFESSFDAIIVIGGSGRIELTNLAAAELFGCRPETLINRSATDFLPDIELRIQQGAPGVLGRYSETHAQRVDGFDFPVELSLATIQICRETLHMAVVRDITERRHQQNLLAHQALHDVLTGLPNRTLLNDRLEQAIQGAIRGKSTLAVALLLLDLDRFKEVNDTLGHHVGDLLLTELGKRLLQAIRKTDTIARLGGDEFAVVLPVASDLKRAQRVSSRMLRAIREPFRLNGLSIDIGASIGIALFPDHGQEKESLLRCADAAMYEAKNSSASIALYDSDNDHTSIRYLTLTGELRRAIEGRHLFLEYQPKLDLKTGSICGAEALARWDHPTLGPIPPEEFIPQAERTGLMNALTRHTLNMAFEQLAKWCGAGLGIQMAINISSRSLHDSALPGMLADLLGDWGIDPHLLSLETTESAIMIDPENTLKVVQRIAEMGIHLSIDDFGTGYSSLSYLNRLAVRELKVDKSFVRDLINRKEDEMIVQSTIDLAHNLDMHVVAEGAENERILVRLAELGCDFAQGYFIGGPMSGDALYRTVRDGLASACPLSAKLNREHLGHQIN